MGNVRAWRLSPLPRRPRAATGGIPNSGAAVSLLSSSLLLCRRPRARSAKARLSSAAGTSHSLGGWGWRVEDPILGEARMLGAVARRCAGTSLVVDANVGFRAAWMVAGRTRSVVAVGMDLRWLLLLAAGAEDGGPTSAGRRWQPLSSRCVRTTGSDLVFIPGRA